MTCDRFYKCEYKAEGKVVCNNYKEKKNSEKLFNKEKVMTVVAIVCFVILIAIGIALKKF